MPFKYLVASGCSFTVECHADDDNNWPPHLSPILGIENRLNVAQGSAGNDYIAQQAVYTVSSLLEQGVNPESILVGIEWSGDDRGLVYKDEINSDFEINTNGWVKNPLSIVKNTASNWIITNWAWAEPLEYKCWSLELKNDVNDILNKTPEGLERASKKYTNAQMEKLLSWYEQGMIPPRKDVVDFYTTNNSVVNNAVKSLKNVIFTQEYLKSKNIKFFMTCMSRRASVFAFSKGYPTDEWQVEHDDLNLKSMCKVKSNYLPNGDYNDVLLHDHPEISWLLKLIDNDYVLDTVDMVGTYCGPEDREDHPDAEKSKMFVNEYIIPFLKRKGWYND